MAAIAKGIQGAEVWECPICFDEGSDPVILHTHETTSDPNTAKKIDHIFHRACIESWLDRSKSKECPLCAWKWDYRTLKPWPGGENKSSADGLTIGAGPAAKGSEGGCCSIYSIIQSIVLTILAGVAVVWALMNGMPLVG